mmetsp:Transcript_110013/g.350380  ORF Transcript_110013/g.350380 Transcript_110013/m.350380 type:complete len:256 (+) Transcript_110013:2420-3187(+)
MRPSTNTRTRSQPAANSRRFVATTRVLRASTPSTASSWTFRATCASSALYGSSSKKMLLLSLRYTALAKHTRAFWPPLSAMPFSPTLVRSPSLSKARSLSKSQQLMHSLYFCSTNGWPKRMFCRMEALNTQGCWGAKAMGLLRRTGSRLGPPPAPPAPTSAACGISPSSACSSEVLPLAVAPTTATSAPCFTRSCKLERQNAVGPPPEVLPVSTLSPSSSSPPSASSSPWSPSSCSSCSSPSPELPLRRGLLIGH